METTKPIFMPQNAPKKKNHLAPVHRKFILQMRARGYRTHEITAALNDIESHIKYGFTSITVDRSTVKRAIARFTPEQIESERDKYFSTFDDVPLAQTKNRIEEYAKIYNDPRATPRIRALALEGIKKELGEDVDKLARAIEKSGSTVAVAVAVNNDPAASPDDIANERLNAARLYERFGSGCDN